MVMLQEDNVPRMSLRELFPLRVFTMASAGTRGASGALSVLRLLLVAGLLAAAAASVFIPGRAMCPCTATERALTDQLTITEYTCERPGGPCNAGSGRCSQLRQRVSVNGSSGPWVAAWLRVCPQH
ncbi:hypothetical protein FJT64_007372 [Amphibalanus amphitrite]|uniref:Uncharacterized protein n=1 Tax=Amphibalanus amphitrite TaxID=1232801 RepID=A0A6A4VUD6_AMPAM|nr:hypothetical protein FJT64_007372 [Amphibalanus amphitrite]